jgi:hypothetical protein
MNHDPRPLHDEPRFAFGLPPSQVDRLRRVLSRCENREVSLEEAWGRAAELMGLARTMLEVLAKNPPEAVQSASSKVDPGDLLTNRPS